MIYQEETKALIKKLEKIGLRPKKLLGQYFLINKEIISQIIKTAEISKDDQVLEIGPGLGILTEALIRSAGKVVAVELDERLVKFLKNEFRSYKNIDFISGDILKVNLKKILAGRNYKVVANLPYYITSPTIHLFLGTKKKPDLLVLLVQKEIAERIVAIPPKMSILAVSIQCFGKPEIVDFVSASNFFPQPKVDSAILKIQVFSKPKISVQDQKFFFRIVKTGFAGKRKQIHNSLRGGLAISDQKARKILFSASIAPERRAETLTLEEWKKLAKEAKKFV